ncbi:MAG: hypothetical protein IJL19_00980 [Clostridiales bacterium]|nr:hypothetical protein [Clostridiales bacterium]
MIKMLYQNINCKGGNEPFPVNDCKSLLYEENSTLDGFVFVEASQKSEGYEDFEEFAKDLGYSLYTAEVRAGQNQVIIGLRNNIKVLKTNGLGVVRPQKFTGRGLSANSVSETEVVRPNYLRVVIEVDGLPENIIGARIPSYDYIDKNGNVMPKVYNAELCSFRQMEEALARDLTQVLCSRTVVFMDGNNARFLGSFDGPYDPEAYAGKAQKNYNLHILRAEMLQHFGLIMKEKKDDYSYGPAHDDHAFFRGYDMDAVEATFFSHKGFDHKGIRAKF